jgi:hypothetical protein
MLNHRSNTIFKASGSNVAFAAGYQVVVYPVGAIASVSSSNDITTRSGHSFRDADVGIVGTTPTSVFTLTADPTDATSLIHGQGTITLSANDKLPNLGPDTMSGGTPDYDSSPVKIYKDAQGVTAHTNTLTFPLTADSEGNYDYYHRGDGLVWELVFDASNTLVQVIAGHSGIPRLNVCDFGAAGNGVANDGSRFSAAVLAAGTVGGDVFVPGFTFIMKDNAAVSVPSGVTISGVGKQSVLSKTLNASDATFDIVAGSDVTIRGLALTHSGDSNTLAPIIDINGASDNVLIENVDFNGAYGGVAIRQCTDVKIRDCKLWGELSHPIMVGDHDDPPNGSFAEEVTISGCDITSTRAGADGIKCFYNARAVSIVNNSIHDCPADAIDLFASGDRVVITGNILRSNTINGIDIKSDETNFAPATYGQGRDCVISNNLIEGSANTGISIAHTATGEINFNYAISGNLIKSNQYDGIYCAAPNVTITGNVISGNALSTGTHYRGIYVLGLVDTIENCTITGNVICNNGETTKSNYGINMNTVSTATVTGNVFDNLATIDGNAFQNSTLFLAGCDNIVFGNNAVGAGLLSYGTPASNVTIGTTTNYRLFNNAGLADQEEIVALTDADATPSMKDGPRIFKTANTGSTTITGLDDGVVGQQVTILINDAFTTFDFTGTGLKGNDGVDLVGQAGDVVTATFIGGSSWYCHVTRIHVN